MARPHPLDLYLDGCARVRGTGAGTAETSFYPALSEALNAVGGALRPKVFALHAARDRGVHGGAGGPGAARGGRLGRPGVWVLDPCCGTGSYLAAVLERIRRTLATRGLGDLLAENCGRRRRRGWWASKSCLRPS